MKAPELAGYFEVPGAHLYTVLHRVSEPAARVLLVGSFASDRHFSYIPWVRWARYLAGRRIECLRYDYRGIGESTGPFEGMRFDDWIDDVELLAGWFQKQTPRVPLVLHGLELGGLIAGRNFDAGIGDGLLLWSPPANANQLLRATLLRRVAADHAFKYGEERKPVSDYVEQLENGHLLEVDGYPWSSRLWRDSFHVELPANLRDEKRAASSYRRPVRIVNLDKGSAPLVHGSSVAFETIDRDFRELFAENFEWITSALGAIKGDGD